MLDEGLEKIESQNAQWIIYIKEIEDYIIFDKDNVKELCGKYESLREAIRELREV